MDIESDEALATLRSIPAFAGLSAPLQRMGGLTNRVYRAGDVCLRIPGKGTEEYIDRARTASTAYLAAI